MHRTAKDHTIDHQVGLSELLVPMLLSTILSFVHSQIVATKSLEGTGINRKTQSYSMQKYKQSDRQRRKKRVRTRASDSNLSMNDRKSKLNLELQSSNSNKFELPKTKNFPTPVEPMDEDENIDETVEDFYNNLVDILIKKNEPRDDDGFESFNGKSDSSEEHGRLGSQSQQERVRKIAFSDVKDGQGASTSSGRFCPGGNNKILDLSDTDNEDNDSKNEVNSSTSRISYKSSCTVNSEWLGITTNSEECSYSSDIDHSDYHQQQNSFDENFTPTIILNPIYRSKHFFKYLNFHFKKNLSF